MSRRRAWFRVHSAVGILGGLLLFLICWSGTVAVVSDEIDWLLNPVLRVTPRADRASWGAMHAALLRSFPDARGVSLEAPLYSRFAAEAGLDLPDQDYVRVYIDPYTAQVLGRTSFFNVQRFFRSFHMYFFDVGGVGYYVVPPLGLVLLVSLLTPLGFYRRWWRGFFKLETSRGLRVFWGDAHKLAGLWGLWFALLIALTGVWYLIEVLGVDLGYPDVTPGERNHAPEERLQLDALVGAAEAQWPDLDVQAIYPPDEWNGESLLLNGDSDAWLVRPRANQIFLDPVTGGVLARQTAQGLGWPTRWVDTADPLHFGNFGGLLSKAVWFLFGLALSGMCLTGAWLHAQRLRRETARASRWPGTRVALAAVVLILAGSAAGAWKEILTYGPVVNGARRMPDVPVAVTAFISGWIAVTLALLVWWARLVTARRR